MQLLKNRIMAAALIALFSVTAYGQGGISHNMTPPPAPRAQPAPPPPPPPPPAPPPQLPPQLPLQMPPQAPIFLPQVPFIPPMAPAFIPSAPQQPSVENSSAIAALESQRKATDEKIASAEGKIKALNEKLTGLMGNASLQPGITPLSLAEKEVKAAKNSIETNRREAAELEKNIADYLKWCKETKFPGKSHLLWQRWLNDLNSYTTQAETKLSFWTAEVAARSSQKDKDEKELKQVRSDLEIEQGKYASLLKERVAIEQQLTVDVRKKEEILTKTNSETVSAGDLGTDEFFGGTKSSKSSETTDIAPIKSMQELREDSVREAFSEMGSLNFQTGFLEKVDVAGQVSQTVIGFIPGLSGTDVALSGVRGFAEALGDEVSKGTSWGDAMAIAAVNAGFKGAVSIAGNVLTGGADKLANRVAVLSEVGFAKLSTKQIAEYGANGISFLVVKSGQVLGQAAVDEFVGKPAMEKIADAIKSAKHVSGSSASGGGYGLSVATQPLVAY